LYRKDWIFNVIQYAGVNYTFLLMSTESMKNPLYCVITESGFEEALDEAYTKDVNEYFVPKDYYSMAGFDVDMESIYFMYFDEWKIFRMIDFFKRNNILLEYHVVENVITFILSDKKYLEVFSDIHNKYVIENYILDAVSVNEVLDRMNQNRHNKEFSLLPIEKEVLGMITSNITKSSDVAFRHLTGYD